MRRACLGVAVAAVVLTLLPAPVHGRAWPRLMMFYGGVLEGERRHMTDWWLIADFFSALQSSGSTRVPEAPAIEIALYWHGDVWAPYAADPARLKQLPLPRIPPGPLRSPASSSDLVDYIQPARLYLGDGSRPPMYFYYTADGLFGPQPLGPKAIELLAKHNVPTDVRRLPASSGRGR